MDQTVQSIIGATDSRADLDSGESSRPPALCASGTDRLISDISTIFLHILRPGSGRLPSFGSTTDAAGTMNKGGAYGTDRGA
ncbi:MAG: hypothetical protein CML50_13375 [Rhodobacteraceae bacterium]|jgi:hypothetical protein|nr:hypothetical protein [Paracoccaceae bacterium]GGA18509.1 hypothetical protein GCM10011326_33920 [Salipiger profundus]